jgi:hypothetical protein
MGLPGGVIAPGWAVIRVRHRAIIGAGPAAHQTPTDPLGLDGYSALRRPPWAHVHAAVPSVVTRGGVDVRSNELITRVVSGGLHSSHARRPLGSRAKCAS